MTTTQQAFPQASAPLVNPKTGIINQTWLQLFIALFMRTGGTQGVISSGTYSGEIRAFGGTVLPSGWLACDGSAVSRAVYQALFNSIGITWGAGDGSTTFNLPNLVNRALIGAGGLYNLGTSGGSATSTLTTPNLPSHNHGVTDPGHTHVLSDPGHTHTVTDPGHNHTITDPGHLHTSWAAAANVTTGVNTGGSTTGNTGTSTTGVTINNNTTGVTIASDTTGATNDPAFTGVTTTNTGSGTAFNTLPPYSAINWMIKT